MALAHSKLTSQGQISVPVEVRRTLGVGAGSVLEWVKERGKVVVRRAGRFSSADLHKALFESKPKPKPLSALKSGIVRHIKRRHARG